LADLDTDIMSGMKSAPAKVRERFLSRDEIAALWPAWPVLGEELAPALRLALATGQRIGEVLGMTTVELDREQAVWTIPAERSKNKFAHAVPLSPLALELIGQARVIDGRLFSAGVVKVAQTITRYRHRLPVTGWTAHDLRRTACTGMAELGVSDFVIGHVVNDRGTTKSSITGSTYVRYDYAREKREALELWAAHLDAIVRGGAEVLPLRG
jgi:integrase